MNKALNLTALAALASHACLCAADPPKPPATRLAPRPIPGLTARPLASTTTTSSTPQRSTVVVTKEEPTVERARIVAIHRRSVEPSATQPTPKATASSDAAASAGATLAPGRIHIITRDEAMKLAAQESH